MKSGTLSDAIDLSVLVDIISNMAGMMVLMACITIVLQQNAQPTAPSAESVKSITFPMAYLPKKQNVTLCMRYGRLYTLPDRELLEELVAYTAKNGQPVDMLRVSKDGVRGILRPTSTGTGYEFYYYLDPTGGVPLTQATEVVGTLDGLLREYPPARFFTSVYVWPSEFEDFREVREYLHSQGMEVGWSARMNDDGATADGRRPPDIAYFMGDHSADRASIKAN